MAWQNQDGLFIKFGKEEAQSSRGGQYQLTDQGRHVIEFTVDFRDAQSVSSFILGDVATTANPAAGAFGVLIPRGFIPEFLETTATTAFTSSGTIGTSTLTIGTVKASDRVTALSTTGFTTTAFVGSVFDAVNENTLVKTGVTGAGAFYGVAATENGLITVANSQHASHPFTAGVLKCRLVGRYVLNPV